MPWNNPTSYQFSRTAVVEHAPQESGVYALRYRSTWVYVGESENICVQLMQHLDGDNSCITVYPGLTFSYELMPPMTRAWRHDDLIRELRPTCNFAY